MNELVRGLVLLMSVVLWLPFLRPTMDGTLSLEQGLLRYVATLLLAWAGGAGLHALITSYAAQHVDAGGEAITRRTDDVTT